MTLLIITISLQTLDIIIYEKWHNQDTILDRTGSSRLDSPWSYLGRYLLIDIKHQARTKHDKLLFRIEIETKQVSTYLGLLYLLIKWDRSL